MKLRRTLIGSFVLLVLIVGISVFAQVNRPFRNGSVWNIAFIRMKPGMETSKKEGIILSYKVLTVEGHTPGEWNVMLMTEYKNLAAMEANEEKADALAQKVVGDDEKQRQGYRERLEIREVMGERLAREIVLEPRSR